MANTSMLKTVAVDIPRNVARNSDLQSLSYDGSILSIRVARELLSEAEIGGIEVTFSSTKAFRCLDESDLANYWVSSKFVRESHVLEVQAGGWSDEEAARRGYKQNCREWLVVSGNACVSVFSENPPTIQELSWPRDA
jgi:hypothetical protein